MQFGGVGVVLEHLQALADGDGAGAVRGVLDADLGAVAELLRVRDLPHAVIDLDDLSLVHPHPGRSFARANLRAVWPSYAAIPGLRVVIPGVVADEDGLVLLPAAVPGSRFLVGELTAPVDHLAAIRDFAVSTHDRTVDDAAREVARRAGWHP